MALFRRTDLGLRGDVTLKALEQQRRDAGAPSGGAGGLWGNISGNINNQLDLLEVRRNLEHRAKLESGD